MRKRILFVALVAVVLTACGSLKQSTESNNNVDNQTIGEAASTEETTKLEHLNTEDNLKEDIKDITNYEITRTEEWYSNIDFNFLIYASTSSALLKSGSDTISINGTPALFKSTKLPPLNSLWFNFPASSSI